MQNYVSPGDMITVVAPGAVSSGDGVLVGTLSQLSRIGHRVSKHGAELYRESAARELVKTLKENTDAK